MDRILCHMKFNIVVIQIIYILVWIFLNFSLAVSDHVVLCIGGNSGIHSVGVSVCVYIYMYSIM